MKRDIRVYLEDILESADLITEYTKNVDLKKFSADIGTQDKILRRLSVIGEIARILPENFKDTNPKLPWEKIAGMRNVIIHEYFGVKIERIWKVVQSDLPKFRDEINALLKKM